MSPSTFKTNGHGAAGIGSEHHAAEPPSPTGQYPGPVWLNGNGHANSQTNTAAAKAFSGETTAEVPEPPSASGQYPGPVWANGNGSITASSSTYASVSDDENVPEPPGATGQYPDPVWAGAQQMAQATPRRRPPSSTARGLAADLPDNLAASLKELDYSEETNGIVETVPAANGAAGTALTNEAIYRIVREVAVADSGDSAYEAVSADREHETPEHPAHQKRHFGLAFGLVLFTQESGRLGRVLQLMHQRDAGAFAEVFGPEAGTLLAVTNAPATEQRLQPVGGALLWSANWIERFKRAGAMPACQYAQNEEAIEGLFRPMLKVAAGLGINNERGLAMMFDRVVARGLGGGLHWVAQAAGPLRTEAQRSHALQVLGYKELRQFQAATPGLPPDGVLGVETYAALVAVLRGQGLVPLPSAAEYACRMVAAATGSARRRLLRLRDSSVLTDTIFELQ